MAEHISLTAPLRIPSRDLLHAARRRWWLEEYYRGRAGGTQRCKVVVPRAPSMPSSFVKVAEQRTMARPMAPIQSSFSFSVSAHQVCGVLCRDFQRMAPSWL